MRTPEPHGRILFEVIWSRNEPKRLGTSFLTSFFAATVCKIMHAYHFLRPLDDAEVAILSESDLVWHEDDTVFMRVSGFRRT
jgi:hypothetical protein